MVASDQYTAEYALERNIPCIVDKLTPALYAEIEGNMVTETFHPTISKWLWAQELVQLGVTVLFLDWDVSVLRSPF